ncbi:MAG: 4-hydroxy-tetrahydrodipicolinate reductase [Arenimonas sp.]
MKKTRLIIFGASGRMGRALLRIAGADSRFEVVAGVTGNSHLPSEGFSCPFLVINDVEQSPDFDVAIDFSQPEAFESVLNFCKRRRAAFVSGTTGLNEIQKRAMADASTDIPVLWASNFSLGVAVLNELVQRAAKTLESWNVEICETHHVHKKDAPSGTALTLGQSVQKCSGQIPVYLSHREGEVIGDHTVRFSGIGEFIELRHNALDRDIFVRGALEAAYLMKNKSASIYQFADLIFDR